MLNQTTYKTLNSAKAGRVERLLLAIDKKVPTAGFCDSKLSQTADLIGLGSASGENFGFHFKYDVTASNQTMLKVLRE